MAKRPAPISSKFQKFFFEKSIDNLGKLCYTILTKGKEKVLRMNRAIYFDMDGTIANLYGCDNWLADLQAEHTKPYRMAKPLVNMRKLGKEIKRLQRKGYHVGIVSWLSKSGSTDYNEKVTSAKINWLSRHLGSIQWDEIAIIPYGTPKSTAVVFPNSILFDDEAPNRTEWVAANGDALAFNEKNLLNVLASLL